VTIGQVNTHSFVTGKKKKLLLWLLKVATIRFSKAYYSLYAVIVLSV
jgi:hypothetical protein